MPVTQEICDKLTDQEIVQKSLVDLEYFSCLFDKYEPKLMRYIKRIASLNHEESEDVLQDAFIKVWKNLNDFDPNMKLSSWIYRIVHNETISYWRKKTSYGKDQHIEVNEHTMGSYEDDNEESIEEKQIKINQILDALPQKYKTILVLKFVEGMSYIEISDVLKIPEGTVATRINRAKKAFVKMTNDKDLSFF